MPGRFVGVSVVVDTGSGGVEGVEMTLSARQVSYADRLSDMGTE